MADDDKDSKTEAPTERHVQEAFDRGQFAKSAELQVVASLIAALGVVGLIMPSALRAVASFSTSTWGDLAGARRQVVAQPIALQEAALVILQVLGPILCAVTVATLLIGGMQTGFRFTPDVLGFKPERLNPVDGFARIFSKNALVHGLVDFLKLLGIGLVLWFAVRNVITDPIFFTPVEVGYLGDFIRRTSLEFLSKLILALGIIAAISYAYEKYKISQDLKMTLQSVKDEHKQSEGDGHTKAAMKRMARRLLQKQMVKAVPLADVVVTNPSHFAVALKYERGRDQAPVVLAKGEDRFAQRLKSIARDHGVPIVENKPVARMLYAMGKVGESIPSELYQAVAGILAFVYRTHRLYFYELKARRATAEVVARRTG